MSDSFEVKIKPEILEVIQKSADTLSMSIEEFVVNSAAVSAIKFLKSHQEVLDTLRHQAFITRELEKVK